MTRPDSNAPEQPTRAAHTESFDLPGGTYPLTLASVAPKPALVVAPTLDRYARLADVEREAETAKKIYSLLGHPEALSIETPVDINRFAHRTQERAFDWLARA